MSAPPPYDEEKAGFATSPKSTDSKSDDPKSADVKSEPYNALKNTYSTTLGWWILIWLCGGTMLGLSSAILAMSPKGLLAIASTVNLIVSVLMTLATIYMIQISPKSAHSRVSAGNLIMGLAYVVGTATAFGLMFASATTQHRVIVLEVPAPANFFVTPTLRGLLMAPFQNLILACGAIGAIAFSVSLINAYYYLNLRFGRITDQELEQGFEMIIAEEIERLEKSFSIRLARRS
ncbi:hypothetical protein BT63DRAFT_425991 [Microthyrium microscopicum]|uniref:Uncharacterized protein n=1 Tax=Microthyrium microscopicum TaxID=703497 RepID=A0A6A6UBL0_9PEZI|nr:hypothetical protein BT63DRAFT_425991 [Microthyrium microscopicum]